VPLSFQDRRVGAVTVITCTGRIVAGDETAAFQAHFEALLPFSPHIVLHLGGVDFIDSSGLGLLVRYLTRAKNSRGGLTVCAVSPKIAEVLEITRLKPVFQPFDTEADAIAAAHRRSRAEDSSIRSASVLCVDKSADVLAYLRELLTASGYTAITASNLPDALILLTATRPQVVVIGSELRAMTGTRTAEDFHKLADRRAVIDLPAGFGGRDAADAAEVVLKAIRACCATGLLTRD
jgi:anti-anti-sigma factor